MAIKENAKKILESIKGFLSNSSTLIKKIINGVYDFLDDRELNNSREFEEKRLDRIYNVVKYVGLAVCTLIGFLLFSGCASKVEYRQVYIPTYCEVENIERPMYNNDNRLNLLALMEYTERLEANLSKCKK